MSKLFWCERVLPLSDPPARACASSPQPCKNEPSPRATLEPHTQLPAHQLLEYLTHRDALALGRATSCGERIRHGSLLRLFRDRFDSLDSRIDCLLLLLRGL